MAESYRRIIHSLNIILTPQTVADAYFTMMRRLISVYYLLIYLKDLIAARCRSSVMTNQVYSTIRRQHIVVYYLKAQPLNFGIIEKKF